MKGWFIAKSKPQKESWLMASLASLGVHAYFPRIAHRNSRNIKIEPLFPTYVFCNFDPETPSWPMIRWAPGLSYFLSVDGHPTRVPNDLVDLIRRRVEGWNSNGYRGMRRVPGERVIVASGPFEGLEGIFRKYTNARQRCEILLDVVGRLTRVEIDETELLPKQAPFNATS